MTQSKNLNANFPTKTGPVYTFNEEEQCALIDMVRYQSVDSVAEVFRNELLLRIALAAVTQLYGDAPLPDIDDIKGIKDKEHTEDLSNHSLAVTFITINPLPMFKKRQNRKST